MNNINTNINAGFSLYKELNQARKDYHKKLSQLGYREISISNFTFNDSFYVHTKYIELCERHVLNGYLDREGIAKELGIDDLPKDSEEYQYLNGILLPGNIQFNN